MMIKQEHATLKPAVSASDSLSTEVWPEPLYIFVTSQPRAIGIHVGPQELCAGFQCASPLLLVVWVRQHTHDLKLSSLLAMHAIGMFP